MALSIATMIKGLNPTVDAYDQLRSALEGTGARGTSFDQATLQPVFPLVDQLNSATTTFAHWLRILFVPWLAGAVIVLLLFVPLKARQCVLSSRRL